MDAGRTRLLGKALDQELHFLARGHHEIGQLVDHHHDLRQWLVVELFFLIDWLTGRFVETDLHAAAERLALGAGPTDLLVIIGEVAHADRRHHAIAIFHLFHRPFECADRLGRFGHDRREEVGNIVVDAQFQHLRIDHDQAQLVRRQAVEQGQDHAVEADGLTRAGRARDEQMRHGCQIRDHRLAEDILAQDDRQRGLLVGKGAAGDQLVEHDGFAIGVRQFDADHGAARNGRDTRGEGGHVARHIVGQLDDAARLDAGGGLQLIHGDDRTGANLGDRALHVEVVEHAFEQARIALQALPVDLVGRAFRRRCQQFGRGQVIIAEEIILPGNRREGFGHCIGIGLLDADRCAGARLDLTARFGLTVTGTIAGLIDRPILLAIHGTIERLVIRRATQQAEARQAQALQWRDGRPREMPERLFQREAAHPEPEPDGNRDRQHHPFDPISRCRAQLARKRGDAFGEEEARRTAPAGGQADQRLRLQEPQARADQRDADDAFEDLALPAGHFLVAPQAPRHDEDQRQEQNAGRATKCQQDIGRPGPHAAHQIVDMIARNRVERGVARIIAQQRQRQENRACVEQDGADQRGKAQQAATQHRLPFRCPIGRSPASHERGLRAPAGRSCEASCPKCSCRAQSSFGDSPSRVPENPAESSASGCLPAGTGGPRFDPSSVGECCNHEPSPRQSAACRRT